jgi:curli production assembly/transport component CsgG
MLFAGMILEGGVIGYDSNVETGGNGARYLGIGGSAQYRRDSVVVSLRAVSTLTGEVLLNVQTYKTILSVGMGGDVFRFLDMDTKLLELETGVTQNESVTWAVRSATEAAVLAMIEQGDKRGFWKINYPEQPQEEEIVEYSAPVTTNAESPEGPVTPSVASDSSQNGEDEDD